MTGLGPQDFELGICIANRPPIDHYPELTHMQALAPGELEHIVAHTSNHWRKLFNVLAKLAQALHWSDDWRHYRDHKLLQSHCRCALLFDAPEVSNSSPTIHVVAGKTYATDLEIAVDWLDTRFAINREAKWIVSPYPDYRQLSNERIARLADLIRSLR